MYSLVNTQKNNRLLLAIRIVPGQFTHDGGFAPRLGGNVPMVDQQQIRVLPSG
jgi:hypothetical protein